MSNTSESSLPWGDDNFEGEATRQVGVLLEQVDELLYDEEFSQEDFPLVPLPRQWITSGAGNFDRPASVKELPICGKYSNRNRPNNPRKSRLQRKFDRKDISDSDIEVSVAELASQVEDPSFWQGYSKRSDLGISSGNSHITNLGLSEKEDEASSGSSIVPAVFEYPISTPLLPTPASINAVPPHPTSPMRSECAIWSQKFPHLRVRGYGINTKLLNQMEMFAFSETQNQVYSESYSEQFGREGEYTGTDDGEALDLHLLGSFIPRPRSKGQSPQDPSFDQPVDSLPSPMEQQQQELARRVQRKKLFREQALAMLVDGMWPQVINITGGLVQAFAERLIETTAESRPNSGIASGGLGPLYRSDPLKRRNLSARLLSAFDRKLQSLDERFACLYTELSTPQPPEGEAKAAINSPPSTPRLHHIISDNNMLRVSLPALNNQGGMRLTPPTNQLAPPTPAQLPNHSAPLTPHRKKPQDQISLPPINISKIKMKPECVDPEQGFVRSPARKLAPVIVHSRSNSLRLKHIRRPDTFKNRKSCSAISIEEHSSLAGKVGSNKSQTDPCLATSDSRQDLFFKSTKFDSKQDLFFKSRKGGHEEKYLVMDQRSPDLLRKCVDNTILLKSIPSRLSTAFSRETFQYKFPHKRQDSIVTSCLNLHERQQYLDDDSFNNMFPSLPRRRGDTLLSPVHPSLVSGGLRSKSSPALGTKNPRRSSQTNSFFSHPSKLKKIGHRY